MFSSMLASSVVTSSGDSAVEFHQQAQRSSGVVLERAESFDVGVNLEQHGPFTQNLELRVKLLEEFDSPWLGVNFDTGNSFFAGHDPQIDLKAIRPWLRSII